MGSSIAYHLSKMRGGKIAVVEKDFKYEFASALRSAGGIRQQFSLPENIKMSMYGIDFIKNSHELKVNEDQDVDVQLHEYGYLFLATDAGKPVLFENNKTQKECGVTWTDILSTSEMNFLFPWLDTQSTGVTAGSFGRSNEGHFDPWSLLCAMKYKAMSQGVEYISADITTGNLVSSSGAGGSVAGSYTLDSVTGGGLNEPIHAKEFVNACGPWSGKLVERFASSISNSSAIHALPVAPRKRNVYVAHSRTALNTAPGRSDFETPLVVFPDTDQCVYFRPEGKMGNFVCGVSPKPSDDPTFDSIEALMSPDETYYYDIVWPTLAKYVPAFESLKLQNSWAGFYEYNTLDQNAIIGPHADIKNLYLCNGFSGHGLQQSPAAGRAIAELLTHGKFTSIDLSRLSFDRVVDNKPIFEKGIV